MANKPRATKESAFDCDALLRESLDLNPNCCGTAEWRGRLCQYHTGYRDGLDAAEEWMRASCLTAQPNRRSIPAGTLTLAMTQHPRHRSHDNDANSAVVARLARLRANRDRLISAEARALLTRP